jgi:hypothetical protein
MTVERSLGIAISFEIVIRPILCPMRSGLEVVLGYFAAITMDKDFCRQQAKLIRSLADKADPFIRRRLLHLAEHYERRLSISSSKDDDVQDSEQQ